MSLGKKCDGFHEVDDVIEIVKKVLKSSEKRKDPVVINYWPWNERREKV